MAEALMHDDVAANLAEVKARMDAAAKGAGRAPQDVSLVAVSKTHPAERVRVVIAAGQRVFGENRVQEGMAKFPALKEEYPDLRLHLIGPLQTNKVKEAITLFDAIESVDRPKLAAALAEQMAKSGRRPDCYIQVNTGAEPQKAGILPAEADAFIRVCRESHGLPLKGLMCIPPVEEAASIHFALLREIARRNGLAELSMGMSGDFEEAIRFGATLVRVGSAIFGARPRPPV